VEKSRRRRFPSKNRCWIWEEEGKGEDALFPPPPVSEDERTPHLHNEVSPTRSASSWLANGDYTSVLYYQAGFPPPEIDARRRPGDQEGGDH